MNPRIIIILLLLPFWGVGQSLHDGLKDTPDLTESFRKVECLKYSIKTETITKCDCYVFSDAIVVRKNSLILEFTRVNSNVYRDNKDKLVEMIEDKNYYIIKSTSQTWYLIGR